jgi:hypothetical protein
LSRPVKERNKNKYEYSTSISLMKYSIV